MKVVQSFAPSFTLALKMTRASGRNVSKTYKLVFRELPIIIEHIYYKFIGNIKVNFIQSCLHMFQLLGYHQALVGSKTSDREWARSGDPPDSESIS